MIRDASVQSGLLVLHIGIDEYQIMNRTRARRKQEEDKEEPKGLIMELLEAFVDIFVDPMCALVVLPMLAGTDFSAVSVAGSTVETVRLPMSLLTLDWPPIPSPRL